MQLGQNTCSFDGLRQAARGACTVAMRDGAQRTETGYSQTPKRSAFVSSPYLTNCDSLSTNALSNLTREFSAVAEAFSASSASRAFAAARALRSRTSMLLRPPSCDGVQCQPGELPLDLLGDN